MKIAKQGFQITEISSTITSLTSDGDRVRFSFIVNSAGSVGHSPMFDVAEIDATIEALQAARRMLAGEPANVNVGKRLIGLTDSAGDSWGALAAGNSFALLDGGRRTREYVEKNYGPVAEIWE